MSKFIRLTFTEHGGEAGFVVNANDVVLIQSAIGLDLDQLAWAFDSIPGDANAFIRIGRKHARGYFVTETVAEIYAMLEGEE